MRKLYLIIPAVLIAFVAGLLLEFRSETVQAGVSQGQEYTATTTRTVGGTALTSRSLKTVRGALGSVVITGAGAGTIQLYDATTTPSVAETYTDVPLLASIPNSAAAGTYVFDVVFSNGLYAELTGTAPTSTITWR